MAFRAFKTLFVKHPLIANAITYGTMYVGAEFSQQTITKKILPPPSEDANTDYDVGAIKRYTILGFTAMPTALFYWYRWLDGTFVGTSIKIVTRKLIIDQFTFTPAFLAFFFVSMSALEGKEDIFAELKQKFVPTFKTSCMFWLPAQSINFLFVPAPMRVVYIGSCSLIWVNVLCYIKRQ